jgi:hypothetical protein
MLSENALSELKVRVSDFPKANKYLFIRNHQLGVRYVRLSLQLIITITTESTTGGNPTRNN